MPLPALTERWLSEAFITCRNHNSAEIRRIALRQLAAWRRGEPHMEIPGYDTPPDNAPGKDAPHGWGRTTFQRLAKEGNEAAKLVQRATATPKRDCPTCYGVGRVRQMPVSYALMSEEQRRQKIPVVSCHHCGGSGKIAAQPSNASH